MGNDTSKNNYSEWFKNKFCLIIYDTLKQTCVPYTASSGACH